jgi:uracil phosphoribosyltransferase
MTSKKAETVPSPAQGVGPFYKPEGEKPTATVSKDVSYENVHILPQTPQLIALLTYADPTVSVRYFPVAATLC